MGDALVQDRAGQLLGPLLGAGLAVIEQHQRMEVPVPGVEHVRHPDAGGCRQIGDRVEHLMQRGPRHHSVLHDVGGADPAHRGERRLAALPDRGPLGSAGRLADLVGALALADLPDRRGLPGHIALRAVQFTISTAPAPSGYRQATAASAASIARASIISIAPGRMPEAMIADTAAPPAPIVVNAASRVVTASGSLVSLTTILVAMPSVPSDPVNAPTRS